MNLRLWRLPIPVRRIALLLVVVFVFFTAIAPVLHGFSHQWQTDRFASVHAGERANTALLNLPGGSDSDTHCPLCEWEAISVTTPAAAMLPFLVIVFLLPVPFLIHPVPSLRFLIALRESRGPPRLADT